MHADMRRSALCHPLWVRSQRRRTASTRRVVLVSHEASLSGAPRVAVEVVRTLVANSAPVVAVLRWGGPLRDDFVEAGAIVRMEPFRRSRALLRQWKPSRRL